MGLFQDIKKSAEQSVSARNPKAFDSVGDAAKKIPKLNKFVNDHKTEIKNGTINMNLIKTTFNISDPAGQTKFLEVLKDLITSGSI